MVTNKKQKKNQPLLAAGHTACAGCGQLIAARLVLEAIGPKVIIANATGCLEVTTTIMPYSSWGVPWIHSVFENAAAVGTGIQAALKYQKKDKDITVLAQGGDGGTFDIGFGLISGMWERKDDILYVCYDNEAYMNTGIQTSGATPFAAATTTSPAGEAKDIRGIGSRIKKKDMPAIAVAHGLQYVATSTIGYPDDIQAKVRKALTFKGPKYIQIQVTCVPGWGTEPQDTIEVGKKAQQTGLYPVYEVINGKVENVMPFSKPRIKVEEYLKMQKRYKHLFKRADGKKWISKLQEIADSNISKLGK